MEKMKRFKRRLSQTLRGSHTIDESLSELAEQMTIEENGLKDSGELYQYIDVCEVVGGAVPRRNIFTCEFLIHNTTPHLLDVLIILDVYVKATACFASLWYSKWI